MFFLEEHFIIYLMMYYLILNIKEDIEFICFENFEFFEIMLKSAIIMLKIAFKTKKNFFIFYSILFKISATNRMIAFK